MLISEIGAFDQNDTLMLDECTNVAKHFIIIKKKSFENIICKQNCVGGGLCPCKIRIFNIRPFAHELVQSLSQSFELTAISNLPKSELNQVVKQLEKFLNKKIHKSCEESKQTPHSEFIRSSIEKSQEQVMQTETPYFNIVLNEDHFLNFDLLDESIPNLHLLLKNRSKSNIFLISSNMTRIVTAMSCGFCAVPVVKYNKFDDGDFHLNLIDNYFTRLKYNIDIKAKNTNDFGILI